MLRILLLGPQGSGKGTQGEFLSKKLRIPLISMGELWRREIERGTQLGRAYKQAYDEGKLAPDEQTSELARRRILEPDAETGFIFDGYPRNMNQKDLSEAFTDFTQVVVLRLSDKEAIKRLGGRRVCSKCGRNYHVESNPPRTAGVCDEDGAQLVVRSDDTPEAIKKRLAIYRADTEPLVEYYREKGLVREIDASQTIEKVAGDVLQAVM